MPLGRSVTTTLAQVCAEEARLDESMRRGQAFVAR
jgi:hypothetical protein